MMINLFQASVDVHESCDVSSGLIVEDVAGLEVEVHCIEIKCLRKVCNATPDMTELMDWSWACFKSLEVAYGPTLLKRIVERKLWKSTSPFILLLAVDKVERKAIDWVEKCYSFSSARSIELVDCCRIWHRSGCSFQVFARLDSESWAPKSVLLPLTCGIENGSVPYPL